MAQEQEEWIKFQRLVQDWDVQRVASSSLAEIVSCLAYQRIIAMGERAVSLILRQLRAEGDSPAPWFWALQVITQADPVGSDDRGNFVKMAQAWLEWNECKAYVKPAFTTTSVVQEQEEWIKFQRLRKDWAVQRVFLSSYTDIILCPAYQRIIAMGERAVPLILRQFRADSDSPEPWFWALRVITQAEPVAW